MNKLLQNLKEETNLKHTEKGAAAYKSTLSDVYDMFALGGAYRERTDNDCILLFKNAFKENKQLALKCLFYLGDCRGGQGERRFFRVCFEWLSKEHTDLARKYLKLIPTFRRWDCLIYSTIDTPLRNDMLQIIEKQLKLDIVCKTPSLLGKWMPSLNTSSPRTKTTATIIQKYLKMTPKKYRKTLSALRKKIGIVETLMSAGEWDKIEFDKIPSKAGLIYKNAFARHDVGSRYEDFIKDITATVNADSLYPYEIVRDVIKRFGGYCCDYDNSRETEIERLALNKYWASLPDYFEGNQKNILCMVDTSGSMSGNPMNVAISLGLYCAENSKGAFSNHYISFASKPQLIKTEGVDFVDKVKRIYKTNLVDNTNLDAAFDLLFNIAVKDKAAAADLPETIVVISDMEIDEGTGVYESDSCNYGYHFNNRMVGHWSKKTARAQIEQLRRKWNNHGLKLPRLVYWNVDARNNTVLDAGPDVSFVSGCSPIIFEQILKGKTGYDLMLDKLLSARYEEV